MKFVAASTFLIIQTAFIGDVILATPLIEKIRVAYPDAEIDFLLRRGNEGLFTNHPYLRKVLIWDKKKGKYRQLFSLMAAIRTARYDYCLNLQRHTTTGLLSFFSGAKQTIGFIRNPFSRFFTHCYDHTIRSKPSLTHEVDLNLLLLTTVVSDTSRTLPRLYPQAGDFAKVKPQKPYITIAPASVRFTKQYPVERWIALVDLVSQEKTIYLLGGAEDADLCSQIVAEAKRPGVVSVAGKLTLLASAALMQGAEMNYVNDSSPLHIATAVGAPVTAVFCSTVTAFGYGPLGAHARVVETTEQLGCRPCGPHGFAVCPQGHFRCGAIPAELVLGDNTEKSNQEA